LRSRATGLEGARTLAVVHIIVRPTLEARNRTTERGRVVREAAVRGESREGQEAYSGRLVDDGGREINANVSLSLKF